MNVRFIITGNDGVTWKNFVTNRVRCAKHARTFEGFLKRGRYVFTTMECMAECGDCNPW